MVCMSKTELNKAIDLVSIIKGKYTIWRKNRETMRGRGVMIMTDSRIKAKKVCLRRSITEVLAVELVDGHGKKYVQ